MRVRRIGFWRAAGSGLHAHKVQKAAGGEKNSGLGCFNGHYALDEFTRAHWVTWQPGAITTPSDYLTRPFAQLTKNNNK